MYFNKNHKLFRDNYFSWANVSYVIVITLEFPVLVFNIQTSFEAKLATTTKINPVSPNILNYPYRLQISHLVDNH